MIKDVYNNEITITNSVGLGYNNIMFNILYTI